MVFPIYIRPIRPHVSYFQMVKVAAILFLLSSFSLSQSPPCDGYYWRDINTDAIDFADAAHSASNIAMMFKLQYVGGIIHVVNFLNKDYNPILDTLSLPVFAKYLEGVSAGQFVDFLDEFYTRSENLHVLIPNAMMVAKLKVGGYSDDVVDFWTRLYRADKSRRRAMLDEYKRSPGR